MKCKSLFLVMAVLLAGCGTMKHKEAPPAVSGGYLPGDGPGANAPANLDDIPDAVPHNEPLHRYANRPYLALGKSYTPLARPGDYDEKGIASWYGKKFDGQRTSSGETYDMYGMTAAHTTLPIPSYARVTNLANNKSVIVRINDRGPFIDDRIIDLSYAAAYKLGIIGDGKAEVEVESIAVDGPVSKPLAASSVQSRPLESAQLVPAPVPTTTTTAPLPAASAVLASLGSSASSVYLQLGAFESQQNAEDFLAQMRNTLGDTGKQFKMTSKDGKVRVHIGPYPSVDSARSSAESMQGKLGFKPMVNLPNP